MSVDILVGGKRLTDKISGYSVSEFATSLDPSDMSGGAGQITVNMESSDASTFARRKEIVIEDSTQGTVKGVVSSTSSANGFNDTLTADSRLIALTYTRTALPYSGTLGGLLRYYFGLVGITNFIAIDPDIDVRPATAPGWNGVVLDAVKRICSANQIELSLVSNNVVVRNVRQRVAVNLRDASVSTSVDDTNLAQAVELFYMHSMERRTDALVYPLGGWSEEDKIISVNAGEVEEVEIDLVPASGEVGLGVSVESVVQPTCIDFVGREVVDQSVYCVSGNDGKPIPASRWAAMGGSLEVLIGEDSRSLIIRVHGSTEKELSPFRISASTISSTHYSSLRILGTGVFFDRRMMRGETGNSPDLTSQEVAQIESDFIAGDEQAFRCLQAAMHTFTGPSLMLSVNTRGINRQSDSGSYQYPTIADFNAMFSGMTMASFNAAQSGEEIADFNAALLSEVQNDFTNQAFGNIAGARVAGDGAWFRVTEATVNHGSITYTAMRDTTMADWNEHYLGMTLADFNTLASGLTVGDLALKPLLA